MHHRETHCSTESFSIHLSLFWFSNWISSFALHIVVLNNCVHSVWHPRWQTCGSAWWFCYGCLSPVLHCVPCGGGEGVSEHMPKKAFKLNTLVHCIWRRSDAFFFILFRSMPSWTTPSLFARSVLQQSNLTLYFLERTFLRSISSTRQTSQKQTCSSLWARRYRSSFSHICN